MSSATEPTIEPAIVLAAYAEPVASGRRVLFVGPASSALPERLLERGARFVLVCDPDPVRLAEATAKNRQSALSFSALGDGQLALREAAFDVAIVEDAGISDPVGLVKKLRRALTPRGVAILASLNPEASAQLIPRRKTGSISLDYYALYDAVKAEFEHVRMLGQAPFVGYVIADFAPEGSPEPSLDTAFLPNGAEEPEIFVAVASQKPVALEAFAVVQLPYRSIVRGGAADAEALSRVRDAEAALRSKLTEAEALLATERQSAAPRDAKLRDAESKARDAEAKAREAETKARDAESKARDAEARARDIESKTRDGDNKARDAEAKAREVETKARESESRSREHESRVREVEAKLRETETKLRETETGVFARDAELTALRRELEQKNRALEAQETKLGELSHKLTQAVAPEELKAAASELSALEQTLAERGEHVRKLERELREAERIGKELLRQLPAPGETPAAVRHAHEAELAQQLAKTQADLVATRWALEAAVKRGGAAQSPEA